MKITILAGALIEARCEKCQRDETVALEENATPDELEEQVMYLLGKYYGWEDECCSECKYDRRESAAREHSSLSQMEHERETR